MEDSELVPLVEDSELVPPAGEPEVLVPLAVESEWLDPDEGGACAGEPSVTATISGPFTPGPKFAEIRS